MPGYISEISYSGSATADFIEIRVPVGTDVSSYSIVVYHANGSYSHTYSLGSVVSTIAGGDVYLVDDGTAGFVNLMATDGVALVDNLGNVVQFVSYNGNTVTATEGVADGLTSTEIGSSTGSGSLETSDAGTSYDQQAAPNPGTVPCYAPGTMIDTAHGPRAVETLMPGDLVMTLDHGPQPIRWTRSGAHPLEDAEDDAKPVQIRAGALGPNLPVQDLIVSPQHRILVGGAGPLRQVFASEAFAPAKSLTAVPGIRHMKGKAQITWIHFACDRHEVVLANGCPSESLLLGPMVLEALTARELRKLCNLYLTDDVQGGLNGKPARPCLSVGDVRRKLAKHLNEKGCLVAKEIQKWDVDLAMEQYEAARIRDAASLVQSGKERHRAA